jgi:hypothetical protein
MIQECVGLKFDGVRKLSIPPGGFLLATDEGEVIYGCRSSM